MDSALNNLQRLICYKTQTNKQTNKLTNQPSVQILMFILGTTLLYYAKHIDTLILGRNLYIIYMPIHILKKSQDFFMVVMLIYK